MGLSLDQGPSQAPLFRFFERFLWDVDISFHSSGLGGPSPPLLAPQLPPEPPLLVPPPPLLPVTADTQ